MERFPSKVHRSASHSSIVSFVFRICCIDWKTIVIKIFFFLSLFLLSSMLYVIVLTHSLFDWFAFFFSFLFFTYIIYIYCILLILKKKYWSEEETIKIFEGWKKKCRWECVCVLFLSREHSRRRERKRVFFLLLLYIESSFFFLRVSSSFGLRFFLLLPSFSTYHLTVMTTTATNNKKQESYEWIFNVDRKVKKKQLLWNFNVEFFRHIQQIISKWKNILPHRIFSKQVPWRWLLSRDFLLF